MGSDVEIPDKLFFRIGEVSQLVGVEPHVLRYWETEFKMRPKRSSSGQRMYQRGDISGFLRIRTLLHDKGFTIAGARKALDAPADTDGLTAAAVSSTSSGALVDVRSKIESVRTTLQEVISQLEEGM